MYKNMTNQELFLKLANKEIYPTGSKDSTNIDYCKRKLFNEQTVQNIKFVPKLPNNAKAVCSFRDYEIKILDSYKYKGFALLHELVHSIRISLNEHNILKSYNSHAAIVEEIIADLAGIRICLEYGIAFDIEHIPTRLSQLRKLVTCDYEFTDKEIADWLIFDETIEKHVDKAVESLKFIMKDI